MIPRLRIIVVDDHPFVRRALVSILDHEADMDVVGEAVDGRAALDLVDEVRPDIVVMDYSMPRLNGLEATRHIAVAFPGVKVVGFSAETADNVGSAMLEAGAAAFMKKTDDLSLLPDVLRQTAEKRQD